MTRWPLVIGSFKLSREKEVLTRVYFIMFINCIIYKELKQHGWHGIALVNHRTWVRAPGPPPLSHYFSIKDSVQVHHGGIPYVQNLSLPRVQSHQSKGHDLKNMEWFSQCLHMWLPEVNEGLKHWARITELYLQMGLQTPHVCLLLPISFIFF